MLMQFPPMGVYETLFKFADATAKYMGDPGTQPWAQGYPLTTQIPGGPALPTSIAVAAADLKYPKATGEIELRAAIADYFNTHYAAGISPEHVAVFAGGRKSGLEALGFELMTGDGGFYHWGRLPNGLSADEFNERLFAHEAGILPGPLCDMARRKGPDGPLHHFVRFSFGPLSPETFDDDMEILAQCV